MSGEGETDIDTLRSELREQKLQLDEALQRLAEVEEALQAERRSVRLQVLEAKEEVRERAERTLDEMRAEKERTRKEFTEALTEREKEIQELTRRLEETLPEGSAAGTEGVDASEELPPAEVSVSSLPAAQPPSVREETVENSERVSPVSVGASPGSVAGAMMAWNLPRLQKFSGEKVNDEDGLKQFVREFERHSRLAGWTGETQRLQFEVHLSGRALRMYESLKEEQRETYQIARDALMKVMQPVKLDSYRRSQFNSRHQKDGETVSDFAEALQRLMNQAFARHTMDNELRDKILLGQLEQGLLSKWKKHLKYPLETFEDGWHRLGWLRPWKNSSLGRQLRETPRGRRRSKLRLSLRSLQLLRYRLALSKRMLPRLSQEARTGNHGYDAITVKRRDTMRPSVLVYNRPRQGRTRPEEPQDNDKALIPARCQWCSQQLVPRAWRQRSMRPNRNTGSSSYGICK